MSNRLDKRLSPFGVDRGTGDVSIQLDAEMIGKGIHQQIGIDVERRAGGEFEIKAHFISLM